MTGAWLAERCVALAEHPWLRAEAAVLADIAHQAVEPLRVAVTGDVSIGKSSLVNALLGVEAAAVARAETTTTATWYRDPALPVPPALNPAHRQVGIGFPLSRAVVLVDTPGVNTASANQHVTEVMLAAGTEAAGAATVVVYLVEGGNLSRGALAHVRSFSALVSGPFDDGANVVLGGSKADGFAAGRAPAGSDEARATLVDNLLREGGRFAGAAVALMPALGALARRGAPDSALLGTLRRIAASDELLAAAADGWGVLRGAAPDVAPAVTAEQFGSTFGLLTAAEVLRARPAGGAEAVREAWERLSGVAELERMLSRMTAHADVYTVLAVAGRLRRLAARLGPERGAPVAAVLNELRARPALAELHRRYVAVLLDLGRLPYVPEDERAAAATMLRGGPGLSPDAQRRWRTRATAGGRTVRDRRIAEIVAEASRVRA